MSRPGGAPLMTCGCDGFLHPVPTANPPGLSVIRYRVGDFLSFRHALLLSRPGEVALKEWRPGAHGDLAVQLVEWWAVLADILTFYNERALTQAFLRTADLPEAVGNLVRLLGYRPRPGIAAHGELAALVNSKVPLTLPKGFAIQSKGKTPQVFESDADVTLQPGGVIDIEAPPVAHLFRVELEGRASVLLAGTITSIKKGDRLLLRKRKWSGVATEWRRVTVREVAKETSPLGRKNTRVTFEEPIGPSSDAAGDWLLLRATQTSRLFSTANTPIDVQYETPPSTGKSTDMSARLFMRRNPVDVLHLEGTAALEPDDALIIEVPGDVVEPPGNVRVARVLSVSREVWYANKEAAATPSTQPTVKDVVPIAVMHSAVRCTPAIQSPELTFIGERTDLDVWNEARKQVTLTFGWTEVGAPIGTPRADVSIESLDVKHQPLKLAIPSPGFLEDAHGVAQRVPAGTITPSQALTVPLQLLTNLVSVSRGKTVPREILGSGDAAAAAQRFTLAKSSLTYLQRGESYASTLRIWVDGIEWHEAPSFYGQPPEARVFVTREDAAQITHVLFGDGIEGARLPSGRDNVVAAYRYGSGEEVPAPGSLSVVLKPQPGVRGVRSPVPMFGGAEPDPPAKIRRYAPATMLALGRAVSGSDYEAIAAQAPGVRRVRAYWSFDAAQQRSRVAVYVGDTTGAVTSARTAVLAARDPNRAVDVVLATPIDISISLTLAVHADYVAERVEAQVRRAIDDDDAGLFGANVVRIGQVLFDSQIHRACLSVPGVVAVRELTFSPVFGSADFQLFLSLPSPHAPGEGAFYRLTAVTVRTEAV